MCTHIHQSTEGAKHGISFAVNHHGDCEGREELQHRRVMSVADGRAFQHPNTHILMGDISTLQVVIVLEILLLRTNTNTQQICVFVLFLTSKLHVYPESLF